ncbi:Insulin-degrading enzyme [Eumeta japonica]|uniref:Insulin-degrading enzyme n=1 Tax=Eumeta variegata TaxID=151549 RepID=A0A4C1T6K3_EUMVA|nr:Insulin-degrading enzyme [Eumeta japonica]
MATVRCASRGSASRTPSPAPASPVPLTVPTEPYVAQRHDDIVKSQIDKRSYRGLVLSNGMKVLLVSDSATDKAAAALDVNVGYLSDPDDLPGLAHFCEHMLFLGTKKYPKKTKNAVVKPKIYEDVELEELLDDDSSQTQKELALPLRVTQQAVSHRLKSLRMIHKQARHKQKVLLYRIVTGDEKWLHYDNPKKRKSWGLPGHASTSTAKPNIHGKKLMLCIWWDQLDIASSDYHLFLSMAYALSEQSFTSYEDTKNWVDSWITSKDKEFFRLGVQTLPERWKKLVNQNISVQENEYNKFLNEHGGSCNASTSSDHTTYYFDVLPAHLPRALDIFAQFFISPLFTETATERELNAVNSEHENNTWSDVWRLDQLNKSTASPDHPYHKFGTGNRETLQVSPKQRGVDVRQELLLFHRTWYSANIMTLIVLGKGKYYTHVNCATPYWN